MWTLVGPELAEVSLDGLCRWMLPQDLLRLESPATPKGVRLLGPHGPFLQLRDRATLVAGKARQRNVWRAGGAPGVALVDGGVVATWRPRKRGERLWVDVALWAGAPKAMRKEIAAEAQAVAVFRGCTAAEVTLREA